MDTFYYGPQAAQGYPNPFTTYPPTPAHSYEPHDDQSHDASDMYQGANAYDAYDAATYGYPTEPYQHQHEPQPQSQPQPQPQLQQPSPPAPNPRPSVVSLTPVEPSNANGFNTINEYEAMDTNGHRSSSEEKESKAPTQSRRKAQNRAAQRAFRERKERHVKDLESKLNSLSAHSTTLLTDNERLKRELQRLATQNEILRATNAQPAHAVRSPSPIHGPQTYSPTDFQTAVGVDPTLHPISYEDFGGIEGQRLLAAGATWDLIQSHELFRKGQLDVQDVCRRLKGRAACDGRGPAFREVEVIRAIEESMMTGSDELI